MLQFNQLSRLQQFLAFLIFLFPAVAITVRHGGSAIYIILWLIAMFTGFREWQNLGKEEKNVIWAFLAFCIMIFISHYRSEDMAFSRYVLESSLRTLLMIPIFLMFRRYWFDCREYLLWGLCVGGVILGAQAVYDIHYLHHTFAKGIYWKIDFGDGAALTAALIILLTLFSTGKSRVNSLLIIFIAVAVLMALYAMVMSSTRGAWLFFLVFITALGWAYREKLIGKYKNRVLSGLVVIAVLIGAGLFDRVVKGVEQGINDIKTYSVNPQKGTSWGLRINMWRDSWEMLKAEPLFGVGVGDYKNETLKMMDEKRSHMNKWFIPGDAHNQFVNSLATTGIIGFTLFMLAFFVVPGRYFYSIWNQYKATNEAVRVYAFLGMILLIAFAVFGIGFPWYDVKNMMNQYTIYLALFMAGVSKNKAVSSQ